MLTRQILSAPIHIDPSPKRLYMWTLLESLIISKDG